MTCFVTNYSVFLLSYIFLYVVVLVIYCLAKLKKNLLSSLHSYSLTLLLLLTE